MKTDRLSLVPPSPPPLQVGDAAAAEPPDAAAAGAAAVEEPDGPVCDAALPERGQDPVVHPGEDDGRLKLGDCDDKRRKRSKSSTLGTISSDCSGIDELKTQFMTLFPSLFVLPKLGWMV